MVVSVHMVKSSQRTAVKIEQPEAQHRRCVSGTVRRPWQMLETAMKTAFDGGPPHLDLTQRNFSIFCFTCASLGISWYIIG